LDLMILEVFSNLWFYDKVLFGLWSDISYTIFRNIFSF